MESENTSDGNISGHWPLVMVISCFLAIGALYGYGIFRALHPDPLQVRSTEMTSDSQREESSPSNSSSKPQN